MFSGLCSYAFQNVPPKNSDVDTRADKNETGLVGGFVRVLINTAVKITGFRR